MNAPTRENVLVDAIKRINKEIDAEMSVIPARVSPDQLLDTEHLAALLMVSPRTLETWRARGQGPKVTKVRDLVRYRYSDVLEFILHQNQE